MRIKKFMKIFIVICIAVMVISGIRWWRYGWDWKLPETLINSVSMEAMASNFDRIKENGYTGGEIFPGFLGVDKGYGLIKSNNPDIVLIKIEDGNSEAAESKVKYVAHSERVTVSFSSHDTNGSFDSDDYRFVHTVIIRNNKGLILVRYYSNHLIQSQRKIKENLETFIQTYCQDN